MMLFISPRGCVSSAAMHNVFSNGYSPDDHQYLVSIDVLVSTRLASFEHEEFHLELFVDWIMPKFTKCITSLFQNML
jgi:hypothetical protein